MALFLILKPIAYFSGVYVFLYRNYCSSLDYDLMSSIWEKGISSLAGNLNSGRSYLIIAVSRNTNIFQKVSLKKLSIKWLWGKGYYLTFFGRVRMDMIMSGLSPKTIKA